MCAERALEGESKFKSKIEREKEVEGKRERAGGSREESEGIRKAFPILWTKWTTSSAL
jgi:hypothetical protein